MDSGITCRSSSTTSSKRAVQQRLYHPPLYLHRQQESKQEENQHNYYQDQYYDNDNTVVDNGYHGPHSNDGDYSLASSSASAGSNSRGGTRKIFRKSTTESNSQPISHHMTMTQPNKIFTKSASWLERDLSISHMPGLLLSDQDLLRGYKVATISNESPIKNKILTGNINTLYNPQSYTEILLIDTVQEYNKYVDIEGSASASFLVVSGSGDIRYIEQITSSDHR
jgi:hypothetical protein